MKYGGRHNAHMVVDGHLTEKPLDSVYSRVISLQGLRILLFLAELNNLDTYAIDIGNIYLEVYTKEKGSFIACKEFGPLAGHLVLIEKDLYGLRTSGLRWYDKFSNCHHNMGFESSRAESDIWMRLNLAYNIYEYIAVYVDDLENAAKNRDTNHFYTKRQI